MALRSVRIASAWSLVRPSGMLVVRDVGFTVFEAAFVWVPTAAALAGAAAFAGVTFGADGALCPTAIKLHISMSHPGRTIFFLLASENSFQQAFPKNMPDGQSATGLKSMHVEKDILPFYLRPPERRSPRCDQSATHLPAKDGHPLNLVVQTEGWATRPEILLLSNRSVPFN